jgi:transcriptional regulator with XRE-family HTH domain
MQTFGEFLARLRKSKGYTQQEVSEKLNISNRTLSSWETGRTEPDIMILPALADLYDITVDELLRGEKQSTSKDSELSDDTQHQSLNTPIAKFATKCALFCGIGCCGAILHVLGSALMLTSSPFLLNIILMGLGLCTVAVCCAMIMYFACAAKLTADALTAKNLANEAQSLLRSIKIKTAHALLPIGAILLTGAAIILTVSSVDENSVYTYLLIASDYISKHKLYALMQLLNAAYGTVITVYSGILKFSANKSQGKDLNKKSWSKIVFDIISIVFLCAGILFIALSLSVLSDGGRFYLYGTNNPLPLNSEA